MDGGCSRGFRSSPYWALALALTALGQAGLSLERLGGRGGLTDDRPVVAGRHPLHLYHATLGAETFRQRYSTTCYDPAFQAGYPKTPIFDGGCRPAEFCLLLAGNTPPTAAYKSGLFALCLMVPFAFALAGRGVGLSACGSCVAAALGCCFWWTVPVQALFDHGDIDLLLAGLCGLVFVSWLSRYHWEPGPGSWLILAASAAVGWYAHPVVFLGLLPVVSLYYLATAPRHDLAWHIGLAGVAFAGVAPNMWWLWDWGRFWWLRQPSVDDIAPFPTWGALLRTIPENRELLGEGLLGWPLALTGAALCLGLYSLKHRSASIVLMGAGMLALFVARLGQTWSPFINGGAVKAAPLAAGLAVLPIAGLISRWIQCAAAGRVVLLLICGLPAVLAWGGALRHELQCDARPLMIGLSHEQKTLIDALNQSTDSSGRILIEEITPPNRPGWNWTALLPTIAPRSYLGGLDAEARFEHAHVGMIDRKLNGKNYDQWTPGELEEFAKRYNIGWVLARSPEAVELWNQVSGTKEVGRFHDGGPVVLLALDRPKSFILAGEAKWDSADRRKVVLTDVVPADAPHPDGGPIPAKVIVLSLHHQPGLKVSPNIVIVERDPCPNDPIPMIRLRMTSPLSRIVISWENR